MTTISAVSFVFNEAENIGACLENIFPFVDQILLVDMDSTDGTLDIAAQFTKDIYRKPHLICGDQYKDFLAHNAKGDWLLWFYPDERIGEKLGKEMHSLIEKNDNFDAYAMMRHEYRDGTRLMPHGTNDSPNYQNRLHRRGHGIYYTDLVHAELHGRFRPCNLPEDYFMEHRKKDSEQEFDNWRTYVEMKNLLWKYRDTKVSPYKEYCDSYRQIIHDSEVKNADGSRLRHPAEEYWWGWWKYKDSKRISNQDWFSQGLIFNPPGEFYDVHGKKINA